MTTIHMMMVNIQEVAPLSREHPFWNRIYSKKRQRLQQSVKDSDFLCGVYGEVLLRLLLQRVYSIYDETLNVGTGEFGKPFLKDYGGSIHYNISHAGQWVLCAVASQPLGVDIERIDGTIYSELKSLAAGLFTAEEQDVLSSLVGERMVQYFFKIWTLKESYIKYTGEGLFVPLNSFGFDLLDEIYLRSKKPTDSFLFFIQNIWEESYVFSMCSKGPFSVKVSQAKKSDVAEVLSDTL